VIGSSPEFELVFAFPNWHTGFSERALTDAVLVAIAKINQVRKILGQYLKLFIVNGASNSADLEPTPETCSNSSKPRGFWSMDLAFESSSLYLWS